MIHYKLVKVKGKFPCGQSRKRSRSNVVWEQAHGPIPAGFQIDHKDRDKRNDSLDNLRLATMTQQRANQAKRRDSRNHYKGVQKLPYGKWRARLQAKQLGIFKSEEEAARAYDEAALIEFGEFACLNFPRGEQ